MLEQAVYDHLKMPHRFVCVTDDTTGVECDTYPLWDEHKFQSLAKNRPNCYRRLFMFSPEAKEIFGEKVLSIDLDCLITGDITSLVTGDDFKILKGYVNPYNGSIWQVKPGVYDLWGNLSPRTAALANRHKMSNGQNFYGSDQAYMAANIPNAPTWDEKDGIYQYSKLKSKVVPDNAKIIFFAGKQKPWTSEFKDLYWKGKTK
jgi:hypothetical protein